MAGKTDKDKIAEFLARNGATVCPPATSFEGQAVPLFKLRRQHERQVTASTSSIDHEVVIREQATEQRYLELQGINR